MTAKKYPLATLLFAFVLVLTSFEIASARATLPPDGQIVICSGQGFVTIPVDAEGNPTGPVHICPDAVAAFVATSGPEIVAPDAPLVLHPAGTLPPVPHRDGRRPPVAQARGPPLSV